MRFESSMAGCALASPIADPLVSAGKFVGVAVNVGDFLTYKIAIPNGEVIVRSTVRSAETSTNINQRAYPNKEVELKSYAESVDVNERKLPDVNMADILGKRFIHYHDGEPYRASVKEVTFADEQDSKVVISLGDGGREEEETKKRAKCVFTRSKPLKLMSQVCCS